MQIANVNGELSFALLGLQNEHKEPVSVPELDLGVRFYEPGVGRSILSVVLWSGMRMGRTRLW